MCNWRRNVNSFLIALISSRRIAIWLMLHSTCKIFLPDPAISLELNLNNESKTLIRQKGYERISSSITWIKPSMYNRQRQGVFNKRDFSRVLVPYTNGQEKERAKRWSWKLLWRTHSNHFNPHNILTAPIPNKHLDV